MEAASRVFDLGDVLSVTTGKLVSLQGVSGIYGILNFMTGCQLFTHQLVRAMDVCAPELLQQHPALKHVDATDCRQSTWDEWLRRQREILGPSLLVRALPHGRYEQRDPVVELVGMIGGRRLH